MELYILRHAWAEEQGPDWPDDSLRPLTPLGEDRFARMAAVLVAREVRPTHVLTSPYARCRRTGEILVRRLPEPATLEEIDALEPGGDFDEVRRRTAELGRDGVERIAWVGHAPDVDDMTAALVGPRALIRFAKGAAAMVRFLDRIDNSPGELRWLVTAKILGL